MPGSIYILGIDNHLALAIDVAISSIPTAACMDPDHLCFNRTIYVLTLVVRGGDHL